MEIRQPRMKNPALILPDVMSALMALGAAVKKSDVSSQTLDLANLRASQINGCSFCVDMHARALRKAGESDERLYAVAAWQDAPYFTDAERAVLALTEAVTRLSDASNTVPDAVWDETVRHYTEPQMATILMSIATVNLWNRLNIATKQVAGTWQDAH